MSITVKNDQQYKIKVMTIDPNFIDADGGGMASSHIVESFIEPGESMTFDSLDNVTFVQYEAPADAPISVDYGG